MPEPLYHEAERSHEDSNPETAYNPLCLKDDLALMAMNLEDPGSPNSGTRNSASVGYVRTDADVANRGRNHRRHSSPDSRNHNASSAGYVNLPKAAAFANWKGASNTNNVSDGVAQTEHKFREKLKANSEDKGQPGPNSVRHATTSGFQWPPFSWEALNLLSLAAVIIILKQSIGAQGLVLAVGGVVTAHSTSLYAAATAVAIASARSMKVDIAAVPFALYACIAPKAVYYILGGKSNWQPGMTLDVSYQLLKGQASVPPQAWSMAQNAGAVKLMAFAMTWVPRVLAAGACVAWLRKTWPSSAEKFGPSCTKPETKTGWLAVQLLMFAVGLKLLHAAVGVEGCTGAVLAAKTMGKAFWAVLIVTFVSAWWNTGFGAIGATFNACWLLGAYVHAERAAGSFASWFMHDMPWASVGIQNHHFQGVVKMPAKLVQVVSGGGAQAWTELTGFAVSWGVFILLLASMVCFAKAFSWWLGSLTAMTKVQEDAEQAAFLANKNLSATCKPRRGRALFNVVPVSASKAPAERQWRVSEEVHHWMDLRKEELCHVDRHRQLSSARNDRAGAVIAALWVPATVGCFVVLGRSFAGFQQAAVALIGAACCMTNAEMNNGMDFSGDILFPDSNIEHAETMLDKATKQAFRASCADSAANTFFEVQLAKDNDSASQGPQEQPAAVVADKITAGVAETAANNVTTQSVDSSFSDRVHKQLPAIRAEQGPAPSMTQTIDVVEADLKPKSADFADSSPASRTAASMRADQADPALKLAQEHADQQPEGSWAADALKEALCRAEQAEAALEEQQLTLTANFQEAEQALKVSKSRVEAAQQALVKEQAKSAKAEKFFSERAQAASKDARTALDRGEQAEAAVIKLQSEKAGAEQAAQAAIERAESAEAAVRHYQKADHQVAKLRRALRKWPALHHKVDQDPPSASGSEV